MTVKDLSLLLTLVLIGVALTLIAIGWRNRLRRQSDVEPLPGVPAELGAPLAAADGQYVASTTAGDWLDRIAVHNLGIRTNAKLSVMESRTLSVYRQARSPKPEARSPKPEA